MITQQKKIRIKENTTNLNGSHSITSEKKTFVTDGSDMIINPELERFANDKYIPEKHYIAEKRLAKSILPGSPFFMFSEVSK